MNISVILVSLFVVSLVSSNKVEAAVSATNIFKGVNTLQNSPWDPRDEDNQTNDPVKEELAEQEE